jgi:PIN domain nuclease of toxin-antitoxin system
MPPARRGTDCAPKDVADQFLAHRIDALPITVEDAVQAGDLPRHHEDPFDRMLIAQAMRGALIIVTADRRFTEYAVEVLPT